MSPRLRIAPSHLRAAAAVLAAATLLGLLLSTQLYSTLRQRGEEVTWGRVLSTQMPPWYLWALLVPVVAWAGRRFPVARRGWAASLAIHAGVALALVLLRAGVEVGIQYALRAVPEGYAFATVFGAFVRMRLPTDLLAYSTILGVASAVEYHQRYRERERAAALLSAQLSDARLRALRMQLNPHFLFNALNSVAMLVRSREHDEAVRLIAGIGELLRYVLDEAQDAEVPLRQELGFVERYLAIERVRFGDRLRVEVEADPAALDCRVPNLVLQPLVENAVRHGISRRARAGRVRVRAAIEGADLVLRVTDDGPGPPAAGNGGSEGVGMRNTRERLRQLYGEGERFTLLPAEGGGAVATLVLPARPERVPAEVG